MGNYDLDLSPGLVRLRLRHQFLPCQRAPDGASRRGAKPATLVAGNSEHSRLAGSRYREAYRPAPRIGDEGALERDPVEAANHGYANPPLLRVACAPEPNRHALEKAPVRVSPSFDTVEDSPSGPTKSDKEYERQSQTGCVWFAVGGMEFPPGSRAAAVLLRELTGVYSNPACR
jgi:hypothetical protein